MRITLVTFTLGRGGAERAASVLANGWASQGKQVTVVTFDGGEATAYPVHSAVHLRHLGILAPSANVIEGLLRNLTMLRALRRAIRQSQPDVVIGFQDRTNILTVLASRGLGLPVVVVEQIDPSLHDIGRIWSFLRRRVYPLADALVCPTARSLSRFKAIAGVKGVAIPNLIDVPPPSAEESGEGRPKGRVLVGMGRLVAQKGFDLLLKAFSLVADKHPEWRLTILGGGPLLGDLEKQAESLNLGRRVHFAGPVSDPFARLRAADLFVFSSRFEGFGMALAEAMACGLPAVSFDCPEGPADIIRDGIDGILVPPEDVYALAQALDRLMGDPEERSRLAARAPEVISRFGPERILAQWQDLFDRTLAERGIPARELPHTEKQP